jgi:hypothetical protein
MSLKTTVARSAIVGAMGLSALGFGIGIGIGLGTSSADPGQPCWPQNCQGDQRGDHGQGPRGDAGDGRPSGDQWRPDENRGDAGDGKPWGNQWRPDQGPADQGGWDQRSWGQRGIDDARMDHQPFNWQGQRVQPYFDNARGAWGFSAFGGLWIQL